MTGRAAFERRYNMVSTGVQQVWLGNVGPGPNNAWCQLRDHALAILVIQTGQNLRDYGYEFPPGIGANPNQIGFPNYAFTSEEKREAAIKKWRAWEAEREAESQVKPNPFRRIP